ncbi:PREDICTED: acetoacetyl-CoA synthetase-like [Amphimedon queenslandica]|uniref:AMP-dependent synthetase/ligase domain-containing protein n=2 Tax=Amphimedon queenslandica TaxID=400682 RepID=A0AAN0J3X4_AMPQE|nr:PREDICTED: acetoacetyl-CoA synthetase-like [Amphimedon queenslandica]|eukprot:XP_019851413.1 PREDICTED: acetoacetyl-CoA synthetase-like [Amphimedon queenslandica]
MFIMYSSGTTGSLKCMVHSAGGTLIQHMKEHILHGNMTHNDIVHLLLHHDWLDDVKLASVFIIDWSHCNVDLLGTGARWLAALKERNIVPSSPLSSASYDYLHNCIKRNVLLGSITGGTDIISCFAGQNLTLPEHKGEIQFRNMGMAVEWWDRNGKPVYDERGDFQKRL